MPRTKGSKNKVVKKVVVEVTPAPMPKTKPGKLTVEVVEEPKVEVAKAPVMPTYDNKKVLKVLDSRHTDTHYHCDMEGGVTMHVPKSLFNGI